MLAVSVGSVRKPMETTPDTGNHMREFIKQTVSPCRVREKMRGKEKGKRK